MSKQVIIDCIKKKYPDLKFEIETNFLGETTLNFGKFTLTLIENLTFKDIIRYIEKYKKPLDFECKICNNINYAINPCNKCANHICMLCASNIIEENEGLMKCPYCYVETGFKMPWYMMIQIRDEFRMRNYDINNKKMNNLQKYIKI